MSLRGNARQKGANDYSNLGVSGRRTGLVLPQGRLDNNGIEEISGIFSSPRKPSPLKRVSSAQDLNLASEGNNVTPKQAQSSRKTRVARSASPRKSGISGTARRSNAFDILRPNLAKENQSLGSRDASKSPLPIPRFEAQSRSPIPRRQMVASSAPRTAPRTTTISPGVNAASGSRSSRSARRVSASSREETPQSTLQNETIHQNQLPSTATPREPDHNEPAPMYDSDDAPPTQAATYSTQRSKEPMTANSTRKRKSDAVEPDYEADILSSPAAKRAKRISDDNGRKKKGKSRVDEVVRVPAEPTKSSSQPKQNKPVSAMSARQQGELDKMVEKIRSRPGQNKSLYILRREKPDGSAVQTRSGRVSVKPLAYWRNERCVFGGSPSGATLQDGARFPLNSIKEIIRTEEYASKKSRKGKKTNQHKKAAKAASHSEVTDSSDEEYEDPDAEEWETEKGTIRGTISVWDRAYQVPIDEVEEVDIAYSAGAISTQDVPGADFKYAKTFSSRFMGSGLVELPGGTVKKPKNSRKMQMTFFVAKGRVTVSVGPDGQTPTSFSIGKGGFWQVPRGNQYSIENEHEKTAMIFFSQGCEL